MKVFEFQDYKLFLKKWMDAQPRQGRGLLSRFSEQLNLSAGMLSQILNGDKHFSFEAANELALFMNLDEEESEYFLLLVSYARAGSHSLRERHRKKIVREQKKASEIGKKLKPDQELPEMVKTVFYSNWLYTGVRNMTACEQFPDVESIADHLRMPQNVVRKIVDFLLQHGLCVTKKGRLSVGPQITHIGNQTSLVQKHHQNWRLEAITRMIEQDEKNVFFTSPMSLSKEAAEEIRLKIPSFIEEIRNLVGPSKSEVVRCLNIDWFQY